MKKDIILIIVVLVCFNNCSKVDSGDSSNFASLSIGIPSIEFISANNESSYKFIPTDTGEYTISLSNLNSDLGWFLFSGSDVDNSFALAECDEYADLTDEKATKLNLTAGAVYYLIVSEYSGIDGYYTITIDGP